MLYKKKGKKGEFAEIIILFNTINHWSWNYLSHLIQWNIFKNIFFYQIDNFLRKSTLYPKIVFLIWYSDIFSKT